MRNSSNMRQLLLILTFTFFWSNAFSQENDIDIERIDNYLEFLDNVQLSAKDYIITQFQKYDIVILAERYHAEETQYKLIDEIIRDDYFISNVGNICIEIGSSNLSDRLNNFLITFDDDITNGEQKLLGFQRNISFYPLWSRESYRIFLSNLLTLNLSLDHKNKVNLYLCDIKFDWDKIKTRQDLENVNDDNRDSTIALNISKCFDKIQNSPRKKLLVILNEAHAIPNTEWIDMWKKRAAQYLSEKYGNERVASFLINSVATDDNDKDILLQEGYWDAAFNIAKEDNVGFDFNGSPFGKDQFDYAIGKNNDLFQYQDIFDGFVFYKPIEQHTLSIGIDNIIAPDFRSEFLRRIKIFNGNKYHKELKADSILLGINKKEFYQYDNFNEMLKEIQSINERYLDTKR